MKRVDAKAARPPCMVKIEQNLAEPTDKVRSTMAIPDLRINDLREEISNLQYLIEVSKDQTIKAGYARQLDTFKERLLAALIEGTSRLRMN
jgi:hypothetical protein